MGKTDDKQIYFKRSQSYRNIFDPSVGWFRPRNDNGWLPWPKEGRLKEGYGCVESNPYQQGWFVPHDVDGLIELLGGHENAIADLENFMEKAPDNLRWNLDYNRYEICSPLFSKTTFKLDPQYAKAKTFISIRTYLHHINSVFQRLMICSRSPGSPTVFFH